MHTLFIHLFSSVLSQEELEKKLMEQMTEKLQATETQLKEEMHKKVLRDFYAPYTCICTCDRNLKLSRSRSMSLSIGKLKSRRE